MGVLTKYISRRVLLLTYEWADLMACTSNETRSVLSTLLRWSSCTLALLEWLIVLEPIQ